MVHAPENWELRGGYSAFFVANYISKLFELCFMTKKSHGVGERGSIVPFFVAKYRSKLFELCFMTKKQQPGSGGLCVRLHKIVTPSEATQTGEQWCGRIPAKIFFG